MYSADELEELENSRKRSSTPDAPLENFLPRARRRTPPSRLKGLAVALVLVTLFRLVAYSRDPILLACVLVVGAVALATAVALWAIAGTAQPPTWLVRVAYVAVGLTALGNIAVFLVLTGGTFAGPLVVTLALQLFMAGYIIRCIREATAAE